jgi:hypothetical protein
MPKPDTFFLLWRDFVEEGPPDSYLSLTKAGDSMHIQYEAPNPGEAKPDGLMW